MIGIIRIVGIVVINIEASTIMRLIRNNVLFVGIQKIGKMVKLQTVAFAVFVQFATSQLKMLALNR